MAATDQTYYSMPRLHKVFAVSSIALLGATIWLLAVDHRRPWKEIQRTSDRIESQVAQWRKLEVLSDELLSEREQLEDALREIESQPLAGELVAAFRDELHADAARRGDAEPAWEEAEELITRLQAAAVAAQVARQQWQAARLQTDKARLDAEDAATRRGDGNGPDGEMREPSLTVLREARDQAEREESQAQAARHQAEDQARRQRADVVGALQAWVDAARFRENLSVRQRRFEQAQQDVAKSRFGLAVRDGRPPETLGPLRAEIDRLQARIERYARESEAAADHHAQLQSLLQAMQAPAESLRKKQATNLAESTRLDELVQDKRSTYVNFRGWLPVPGKKWLELPILDAFNSPRKIHNLWCEGLDQPLGSFGRVRRFDRCVTCHEGIGTALPEAPHAPQFGAETTFELALQRPASGDQHDATASRAPRTPSAQLDELFGLQLAEQGLLDPADVTVLRVRPASAAARATLWRPVGVLALGGDLRNGMMHATTPQSGVPEVPGLRMGDVVVAIDGQAVPRDPTRRDWVAQRLIESAAAGADEDTPAENRPPVRLTVRRGLPHPYAGHPRLDLFVGPDSPHPMHVFGCTVCHEGQGSATSFQWASHAPNDPAERERWQGQHNWSVNPHWDFPMVPRRFAESLCLKCHHQVSDLEPSERFPDPPAPKLLDGYRLVRTLGCFGCHEIHGYDDRARQVAPDLRLEPDHYADAAQVPHAVDHGPPGSLRKVGPSLRFVGAKLDANFLADWIRQPQGFRPDTTMPRAFGLWNHVPLPHADEERFESLATHSMARYLLERSQPYAPADAPAGITPVTAADEVRAQIARGRIAFQETGCLVCHNHADFPDFAAFRDADTFGLGPDLSRTADKFAPDRNPDGAQWLSGWIRDPSRYDLRTTMPAPQLAPVEERDEEGRVVAVTDPVADMVAYLLSWSAGDWKVTADFQEQLDAAQLAALHELTLMHLRDGFPPDQAERIAQAGASAAEAQSWRGPERELIVETVAGTAPSAPDWIRQRLFYVARKSLLANGCYACHDIPGTEDDKPIGPSLTGWGRKNTGELAFGHVLQYLQQQTAAGPSLPMDCDAPLIPFVRDELRAHSRIGFILQKLAEPRSFDFRETGNKKVTARLRMPQFDLTPDQREAIATFVLGLVSDPPTPRFAYQPSARTAALIAGRDILNTYQCRGCHIVEPESWEIAFPPDTFGQQRQPPPHPFVPLSIDETQLAASRRTDRRGWRTAVARGMPALGNDGKAEILDEDGYPLAEEEDVEFPVDRLQYLLQLWLPSALDGWPYQVGEGAVPITSPQIQRRRGADGGALAKYLAPYLVQRDRIVNPNARGTEAWAWLPPHLIDEGTKVQPQWLYEYLLDPQPIRPAVAMRMPKYNLSTHEAGVLTAYFAAKNHAPHPYPGTIERTDLYLAEIEARYALQMAARQPAGEEVETAMREGRHLAAAMKIVTSGDYCIKCHRVADFDPAGLNRTKAADLSQVYRRLRPDYLRTWLARPTAVLPYTAMPVNIPYDPQAPLLGSNVAQSLYPGDTLQQLQALVDLLMNYDTYARQQARITPLVETLAPSAGP